MQRDGHGPAPWGYTAPPAAQLNGFAGPAHAAHGYYQHQQTPYPPVAQPIPAWPGVHQGSPVPGSAAHAASNEEDYYLHLAIEQSLAEQRMAASRTGLSQSSTGSRPLPQTPRDVSNKSVAESLSYKYWSNGCRYSRAALKRAASAHARCLQAPHATPLLRPPPAHAVLAHSDQVLDGFYITDDFPEVCEANEFPKLEDLQRVVVLEDDPREVNTDLQRTTGNCTALGVHCMHGTCWAVPHCLCRRANAHALRRSSTWTPSRILSWSS